MLAWQLKFSTFFSKNHQIQDMRRQTIKKIDAAIMDGQLFSK